MNRLNPWLALVVAAFVAAGTARSQSTFATITGSVRDASGAAIPGAAIQATEAGTGYRYSAESNASGVYTLANLREGKYRLHAHAAGLRDFVANGIELAARDIRRIDITLEVAAVETSIEVTAGATLIETETARISNTKGAELLSRIPLMTRAATSFLRLAPTVVQTTGSSVIRFGGSRGGESNWAIDGTTMSDGVSNTQIGPLANYIESFQELKIDLTNNSAEFAALGQVTMISKSGTNAIHGSVFDYFQSPVFRARDPFAVARQAGVEHRPGGTIGGPVYIPHVYNGKNKTFFFTSFETSRGSAITQNLAAGVPLPSWRKGDFSGEQIINDPLTGLPFPGNLMPSTRINAVSQKIQDRFYPLPNFGNTGVFAAQNYREAKQRAYDPSTYFTARIDERFSDKDSIFGRFTWHRLFVRQFEGNLPTIGQRDQIRANKATTVSHTHVFSPSVMNEFRWGYALNNPVINGPVNGPSLVRDLGLTGLAPDLPDISGLLQVSWTGISLGGLTQVAWANPNYWNEVHDFQERLSWFKGRHTILAGANISHVEYDTFVAPGNLFGSVTFSNRFTSAAKTGQGQPYADFLLGIPTSSARAFPPFQPAADAGPTISSSRTTSRLPPSSLSILVCGTSTTRIGGRPRTGWRSSIFNPARSWSRTAP